jgi:hypothetical protein
MISQIAALDEAENTPLCAPKASNFLYQTTRA